MFVDFENAFDNIWRRALWFKSLYNNSTTFLWICKAKLNQELFISNEFSPFFNCENSVRKGEKLSVFFFIFHIYNYLIYRIFLIHLIFNGYPLYLKCLKQIKLNVFLKLFAFLYADDTIILLAKSSEELQKQLLKA